MSYEEVLPAARALSRIDKLRLIRALADELAQSEDENSLVAGRIRPVAAVPAELVSRRRWKYLRVSVRGLIILVLVIGSGLGWLVRSARIQREAAAAITKAGGDASYGSSWAPNWLVDSVGDD